MDFLSHRLSQLLTKFQRLKVGSSSPVDKKEWNADCKNPGNQKTTSKAFIEIGGLLFEYNEWQREG